MAQICRSTPINSQLLVTDELCSMTDLRHAIREWIFQSGISRATGVRYGRARAPDLQGALSRDQRTARKMTGCCYRVSTLRRLSTTSALVRSAGTRSRRAAQAIIPMISRRAESPRPAATRPGATGAMPTGMFGWRGKHWGRIGGAGTYSRQLWSPPRASREKILCDQNQMGCVSTPRSDLITS